MNIQKHIRYWQPLLVVGPLTIFYLFWLIQRPADSFFSQDIWGIPSEIFFTAIIVIGMVISMEIFGTIERKYLKSVENQKRQCAQELLNLLETLGPPKGFEHLESITLHALNFFEEDVGYAIDCLSSTFFLTDIRDSYIMTSGKERRKLIFSITIQGPSFDFTMHFEKSKYDTWKKTVESRTKMMQVV